MAQADAVEYASRPGPEDKLQVISVKGVANWRTGGAVTVRPVTPMLPWQVEEVSTLRKFMSTKPYSGILGDLIQSRHLCMPQMLAAKLCFRDQAAHLRRSHCAEKTHEFNTCSTKVARLVQTSCKPEVQELAACMRTKAPEGSDPRQVAACADKFLAFDMCTEEF